MHVKKKKQIQIREFTFCRKYYGFSSLRQKEINKRILGKDNMNKSFTQ